MEISYCFEAKKRAGSTLVSLLNGELRVSEGDQGRVLFHLSPICHEVTRTPLTHAVDLRGQEFELEARSPENADHPYSVTVHAADDPSNKVEVWVKPDGEPEMMIRFYVTWGTRRDNDRCVQFETLGHWTLLVTV